MAEPAEKAQGIRDIQSDIMGADVEQAIRADTCVRCKQPATAFRDAISRKEFALSGLCQTCQDAIYEAFMDDEE